LRLHLADEISSDADSLALIHIDHFLTPLRAEQLIKIQRRSSGGAGGGSQERCRITRCAKWTKPSAHFERVVESTRRIKQAHHPILSAADEGEELHGLETHACHYTPINVAEEEVKCRRVTPGSGPFLSAIDELAALSKSVRIFSHCQYVLGISFLISSLSRPAFEIAHEVLPLPSMTTLHTYYQAEIEKLNRTLSGATAVTEIIRQYEGTYPLHDDEQRVVSAGVDAFAISPASRFLPAEGEKNAFLVYLQPLEQVPLVLRCTSCSKLPEKRLGTFKVSSIR
jgi:hypothetical protein